MRTAVVGHTEWVEFGHVERVPAAGDIVWFPGHVGIYVGGGAVVNATHTGDFVRIHPVSMYSRAARPG